MIATTPLVLLPLSPSPLRSRHSANRVWRNLPLPWEFGTVWGWGKSRAELRRAQIDWHSRSADCASSLATSAHSRGPAGTESTPGFVSVPSPQGESGRGRADRHHSCKGSPGSHTLTHARERGDRKKQRRRVGSQLEGWATRRPHGCYVCALGKQRCAKKSNAGLSGWQHLHTHSSHTLSRKNTSMGVGCHLA